MTDARITALLDDPVRAALTTANRALAQGGPPAWRFLPEVAPFAAIADRTDRAFAALAALIPPDGRVALVTADPVAPPAALTVALRSPIAQMVLDRPAPEEPPGPGHVVLGAADVPEMIDLTGRTRPGPFGPRTIEFGHYIGLRIDGALMAMAGERMRFDRFVEISAVCVDPAHRGKGFAALLMIRLARRIQARGLTPFLHVFADNASAIALYGKLGFARRRTLHLTVLSAAA
ncbi:GNAT family N-acetyltransferase [Inquilinus sp.]|uniref:GNAT family N-acetyltransferase n=1 Tax=Inquilinus sp. TaxID=1932117 RepID=UPI0031DCE932